MSALGRDLARRFNVTDVDAYEAAHDRYLHPHGDSADDRLTDALVSIRQLHALESGGAR